MKPLNIVFFGTPEPSKVILEALSRSSHEIVGVITRSDKRRQRGSTLHPTPVKIFAQSQGYEVYTPKNNIEIEQVVESIDADIAIVVAYGKILSQKVLDTFEYGCINVHYSLLPKLRGAAPVERAILHGDLHSGISIMKMDEGLDTGDVYSIKSIPIEATTTSIDLYRHLGELGSVELIDVLDNIDTLTPSPQSGETSYAHKLEPKDFYFDEITTAQQIDRQVRAGVMIKGAWTTINSEVFRVHQAKLKSGINNGEVGFIDRTGVLACSDSNILLEKIQVPSKPVMDFSAWANGVSPDLFPMRIAT